MSLSDKAHRLRIGLREITSEMEGMNPNTTTYKKLDERKKKVLEELEQLGAQRVKTPHD